MPAIHWTYLIVGLALCLGGWILYWATMNLAGGLAGAFLGGAAGWIISIYAIPNGKVWIVPIAGGIGFIVGIFMIRGLHRFLFFFIGSSFGMAAGHGLFAWCNTRTEWVAQAPALWQVVFVIVGSVLGGMVLVWGSRWIVALTTSVVGAVFIVVSVDEPLFWFAAIPLAIGSLFLQVGLLKRLMPAPRARRNVGEEGE